MEGYIDVMGPKGSVSRRSRKRGESTCTRTTSSTAGTDVDEHPSDPAGIPRARAASAGMPAQQILSGPPPAQRSARSALEERRLRARCRRTGVGQT
jgi:hypothetical protein